MASRLLGLALKTVPRQAIACTAPLKLAQPCAAFHGRSRIGNRDVVGYGINGSYGYIDRIDYPMPAIRFKENTADVIALREKEKGDWKKLTLAEKKELYRASFCLTFAEQKAPTGEWKFILGGVLIFGSLVLWIFTFLKKFGFQVLMVCGLNFVFFLHHFFTLHVLIGYVYPPMPRTMTPEHKQKMLQAMIDLRIDPIDGLTSKYDYENKRWKD